jgi:hypothetical protein
MQFYGLRAEPKVNNRKNQTYVPIEILRQYYNTDPNLFLYDPLDFALSDVDGFNLEQVLLDEIPDRRNGLPSHSYTYSYDGNMHIFPLYNGGSSHGVDVLLMDYINRLMVCNYTYIVPYLATGEPTYDEGGRHILNLINQNRQTGGVVGSPQIPSGIRVGFNGITTIHNNGIGANKEYDLSFSVYGIWNADGLLPQFRNN